MDSSLDSEGRGLPICLITGRIAGDRFACGDCDPCSAKASVSAPVKHLMAERDAFANKYEEAVSQRDALVAALSDAQKFIRKRFVVESNGNGMFTDKDAAFLDIVIDAALASASEEKKEMA